MEPGNGKRVRPSIANTWNKGKCSNRASDSPGADSTRGSSPAVSVIVLNWNGIHHLKECLSSLREQTLKDFEVILVDNGSTDGSVAYVRDAFPEVRVLPLNTNQGFSAGNNKGIQEARGEFVVLLNNDTIVDRHWLEELYQGLRENPEVGFCSSKILLYYERDTLDSAGDYYGICGAGGRIGRLHKDDGEYNHPRKVFGACAGAAMYRKTMLDEIGLLDEDFFLIYEDTDLSFRAQLMGYQCLYVPSARVYHKVNASMGRYSDAYVYYGHRNVEYVYIKNMPFPLVIKYLPIHLVYVLLTFAFFTTKGKALPFLRAKLDVLRSLPRLMKKREQIQQSRRVPISYIDSLLERDWLRPRMTGKNLRFF